MAGMMGTKTAAAQWGCDQAEVWEMCRSGLIEGAVHEGPGRPWRIPESAKCPRPGKSPDRPKQTE